MKRPKIYFSFVIFWTGFKPFLRCNRLLWKDKFGTPRCELSPSFEFYWLWFSIVIIAGNDYYWEQWLWIKNYYGGDVKKARANWPWVNMDTKNSTWKDEYLKRKIQLKIINYELQ